MDEIKKMLSAFINSQSAFNQRIESELKRLGKKIEDSEKNLTRRIDALGKQLAYVEDDTPTRDEFDDLEKRVDKIERRSSVTA